jgi:hypothetical protein
MAEGRHVPRLANLRTVVEQRGPLTGEVNNLLRELKLSRLDANACDVIADSLMAAGLKSAPPISVELRRNTVLELTLVEQPASGDDGSREQAAEVASDSVLRPFATDNPYLQRLFKHELFGVVPDGCPEVFRKLETAAPEEALISAMKVRHGVLTEGGFLMITTHWLRYVKHGRLFTAIANDDFWPLDASMELIAKVGEIPLFRTSDGNQFQIYPAIPIVTRRQAKTFYNIYRLAALAIHHLDVDPEEVKQEEAASPQPSGIVAEIKDLVGLRDAGVLSASEFETAKARLLGS